MRLSVAGDPCALQVAKNVAKVYSVKATCTLHDMLITDFQQATYRRKVWHATTLNLCAVMALYLSQFSLYRLTVWNIYMLTVWTVTTT